MRSILIILFFMLIFLSAKSQSGKWQPGHFTDVKGNKETGFIRVNPSGRGPVKQEGFIEFKENEKAGPYKLSAGELRSFVAGSDSFIVAHAPKNEVWTKHELDFVKVVLNEEIKLYSAKVGGGRGIGFAPEIGAGFGSGGYGGGLGGGISIPLGGHGGGEKNAYYFGANTSEMQQLTNENFQDIMIDIMGDEPEVINKIQTRVYTLSNIDKLIIYFKQVQTSHAKQ